MRFTIKQIASIAKVSKGTVSKVLHNYPGISKKTRERVLDVIKKFNYEPNFTAQSLAFRRSGNIGLLIPHDPEHSISGAYWSSLVTAITKEVIRNGYNLVLLLLQKEGHLDNLYRSILWNQKFDGLIIGAELLPEKYITALTSNEIPFVMLGRNPKFSHYSVDVNNFQGGYLITRYMINHGYKKIAFVTGPKNYFYNWERAAGYAKALREFNLDYQHSLYLPYENITEMRKNIYKLYHEYTPDAFLCGAGGNFLFDLLTICKELSIKIPQTGLASFDNYRFLDFIEPKITAVSQPIQKIGSEAVRILIKLINNEPVDNKNVVFNVNIIPRLSCGEKSISSLKE